MKFLRSMAMVVAVAGFAVSAFGDAGSGNIYGTVDDEQGGVLPGVSVTLSGCGAPRSTTTGAKGDFRFLSLSPCTYIIRTEISGFQTVERTNVTVNLGTNTELTIGMKIASVKEVLTISSEPALIDTKKQTTGSNIPQAELKSIPTARDPWVILQQVPGVLVDRMNVGGSVSGQQDNYVGKGTDATQNAWNVDGVTITDMGALGSSPTYYDFDAFQEIQATTGGSDPSIQVPGVSLNMVTKRGTNDVHGSARVFDTPSGTEAHNDRGDFKTQQRAQGLPITSNHVDNIQDYGVEAGGPVWTDKAWLWGSYGRNQINLITAGGTSDKTTLEDFAGKLNIQPVESNSGTFFYFRGDKNKFGRNSGPTRPQPTSWDQKGPTTIWKGEDSQVFGPNLVANVAWSYTAGGFSLIPEGGLGVNAYQDPNKVWQRSYYSYSTYRPNHQINGGASAFFNTGSISHEVKFGFGYRNALVKSVSTWPGDQTWGLERVRYPTDPGGFTQKAGITRAKHSATLNKYYDGFIGDTITASNLTINVGVRYDDQYGANSPSFSPANSTFPELLGDLSYPGQASEFKWKNWQPRAGLTYAIGAEKKTLLRASYARFADQLGTGLVASDNPNGAVSYLYYRWNDANHDHNVNPGELGRLVSAYYVDPNNPNSASSPNKVDPNFKAPTTDEFTVGFDHQILPELVGGFTYTYRHRKDLLWNTNTNWIGLSRSDFTVYQGDGSGFLGNGLQGYDQHGNPIGGPVTVYQTVLPDDFTNGTLATNRPDYTTNYHGFELQFTKRLSNHWMAHGGFTYTDQKQKTGAKACVDPTNQVTATGPGCSNDIFWYGGVANSGAYSSVFIDSRWAFNVNGLYQLPMNFNIAANFYGRQGYPIPYSVKVDPGDGLPERTVLIGKGASARNKNVYQLDLRAEKVIPLFQKADLTLSIDMFNALNDNTVLQRRYDATPDSSKFDSNGVCTGYPCSAAGQIQEVHSPRILRFGARLSF